MSESEALVDPGADQNGFALTAKVPYISGDDDDISWEQIHIRAHIKERANKKKGDHADRISF